MHYGCPKDDEGKPLTGKAFLDHKVKTKCDNIEWSKRTGQLVVDQSDEELELEEDTKLPASQGSHPVECLSSEDKTSSVEATQHSATAVAALPPQPKTVAASNPSDSSLSETDVPEMQIPWIFEDQRTREFLMNLHNIPLMLSGCCKDIKTQIAVMEDVVKLAEGITNADFFTSHGWNMIMRRLMQRGGLGSFHCTSRIAQGTRKAITLCTCLACTTNLRLVSGTASFSKRSQRISQ